MKDHYYVRKDALICKSFPRTKKGLAQARSFAAYIKAPLRRVFGGIDLPVEA